MTTNKKKINITAGCGKGRKCDITIYVLPQGSTKDNFQKYTDERVNTMREDELASQEGAGKW
jgi:hypothetical protein